MAICVGSLFRSWFRSRVVGAIAIAVAVAVTCGWGLTLSAQQGPPLRKIGELELAIRGLTASVEARLTVPKNVASGVRVEVYAGATVLTLADAVRMLGGGVRLEGELSGPGLTQTLSLPGDAVADPDSFLLRLPALTRAGHYALSNLRLVRDGRTVLDVAPNAVDIEVIDEILITSVTTRPLTLDEIRQKGIVLDGDDYLGFEFTMAMRLESTPVNISFPVAFNREGVAVPAFLTPPSVSRNGVVMPTIVPMLLEARPTGAEAGGPGIPLTLEGGEEIRIPSLLVIPGNVGYLKQFFSAQLFVANGAPPGARLTVRDITGTIALPAGADHVVGTTDDPLALAQTESGVHATLPIRGVGLDGQPGTGDDRTDLGPGEQGQAEFLIRGDLEGFHTIGFDIRAALDGLPIGPVTVTGKASGGVLVRNPYFDITFTAPAVVRDGEPFSLFATVTNIGQGIANDLNVALDSGALSGLRLIGSGTQQIASLRSGDSAIVEFEFESQRTGQVVASYLNFDTTNGTRGDLNFTVGIGERGVPLSPDTLVLPAVVDRLPKPLVKAAMRVLGQAWSVANAPAGTLRSDVLRPSKDAVVAKALALAEAGLRLELGQAEAAAFGDLALDWYVGAPPTRPTAPLDPGLDQIHRDTDAGHALARAFGDALGAGAQSAGGPIDYERARTAVAMSGPDFVSFVVTGANGDVTLEDAAGRRSVVSRTATRGSLAVPGAAFIPLGPEADAPILGLITRPLSGLYTLGVGSTSTVSVATTSPRGDGRFARGAVTFAPEQGAVDASVQIDLARPDRLATAQAYAGDDVTQSITTTAVASTGPSIVSAHVVGPETLDSAGPFGLNAIVLFDRAVDPTRAALPSTYRITRADGGEPINDVVAAQAVLSGRFVAVSLAQPEGPYVAVRLAVAALPDARGVTGIAGELPLTSRLTDPGAVVTGRVQQADGTPIAGSVVYTNNTDIVTCYPTGARPGLARATLDATGRYEFRYVRQDNCGFPFTMITTDPQSGGRTEASRHVRGPGERIVVDFTLLARGTVAGTVRDADGDAVGGATVVARSVSDPQIGGIATTDGEGFYVIPGITVGGVTVRAVRGTSEGHNAGRIDRGGTTATVNVTMDGGTARVEGVVSTPVPTGQAPVRGAVLTYQVGGTLVGYTTTDDQGRYVFDRMPSGAFSISARYDLSSVSLTDTVGANQTRHLDILLNVPQTGTVQGVVRRANGSTVAQALVSVAGRGMLTGPNGEFSIAGVATGAQTVLAATQDELQQGTMSVTVPAAGTVTANITLSGLGSVRIAVVGSDGQPARNATVTLAGRCSDPCGCVSRSTGPTGAPVTFDSLRLGRVDAKAFLVNGGTYDSAATTLSLVRDGETVEGVILLRGFGTITGTVFDANNQPAHGADVVIDARHFVNDGGFQCGMVSGPAHRVRTDVSGRFRVPNVGVGPVTVTATQAFAPTPAVVRTSLALAGQTVDVELRLTDTIAGELSGRVLLPDGVTPAGVGVTVTMAGLLPDVVVRTDADGLFHFARVFPEGRYVLTARDPLTGGQVQEQVYLQAGQNQTQDLRLKGRGRLVVTVEDAAGEPIDRASVRVVETAFPGQRFERTLDASTEHRAVFEGVFEGPISIEAFELVGNRGGRLSTVMVRDGTVDAVVRLGAVGTVHGTLRMPGTGTPVPFATVRLLSGNRVIGQATTGEVDAERGTFHFDYVPAGPFTLDAVDPSTGRTGTAPGRIDTQGQDAVVDITLQALGTVTGLITSNGDPRPAALVEIQSGFYRITTLADSEGRYRVEGVPEGQVTVTASIDGRFLAGTAVDYLRTDGQILTLDVALRSSSPVTGQVQRFDGSIAPLAVVTVKAGGFGGGWQTTPTDGTGHFAFDRVPDGSADIEVEVPGSADRGLVDDIEIGPSMPPVTVRLNGVGRLEGRALDANLNGVGGILRVDGVGTFRYQRSIVVPSNGQFAFPELLAGPVTLSLRTTEGGFTRYGTATGTIVPAAGPGDPASVIDVTLQDAGTVTLRVLRADGVTPAAGADVRIQLSAGRGIVDLPTGIDGRLTATGVPLGSFLVKVTDAVSGGVAYVPAASVDTNGQIVDLGDLVVDITPLSIVSSVPADGATEVSTFDPVRVVFSQPLYPGYTNGIRLYAGATLLPNFGVLSADGRTLTFTGTLPTSSEITLSVPTSVFDVFLRHPPAPITRRFQTTTVPPLAVVLVTPADGSANVATNTPIRVEFSVPVVSNGLRVMNGASWLSGATITMSENDTVATIVGPWPAGAALTIEAIGTITRDIYGRLLGQTYQSHLWIQDAADVTPPFVRGYFPATGARQVSVDTYVEIEYSEPVAAAGIENGVYIYDDGVRVPATTTVNGRFVRIVPTAPLSPNTWYGISARDARDLNGNLQDYPRFSHFATPDTVAPVLTFTAPAGSSTIDQTPTITVQWEDAVTGVIPTATTVTLRIDGQPVPSDWMGGGQASFTPTSDVSLGPHTIVASVTDQAGNTATIERVLTITDTSASVRLTYMQQNGQPGFGATARLYVDGSYIGAQTTDETGRALFTGLPAGEFRLDIEDLDNSRGLGIGSFTLTTDDLGLERLVLVRQAPRGTVIVRAFAADNSPMPSGLSVPFPSDFCSECGDGTDLTGVRVLRNASPHGGVAHVFAQMPTAPYASVSGEATMVNDGDTVSVDLHLPASVVRGVARFTDGVAIGASDGSYGAGLSPFATWTDAAGERQTIWGWATGEPGAFVIFGVPVGSFAVSVQDSRTGLVGSAPSVVTTVSTPVSVPITMEPAADVVGIVRGTAGLAVSGATVSLRSAQQTTREATTDEAGAYRISHVGLGAVELTARASDLEAFATGTVVNDQEPVTIDVQLPPSSSITGTVVDATGAPVAGVSVEAYFDSGGHGVAATNATGAYTIHTGGSGSFVIYARLASGLVVQGAGTLDGVGSTTAVDFTLPPTGTLVVRFRRHDGSVATGSNYTIAGTQLYLGDVVSGTGDVRVEHVALGEEIQAYAVFYSNYLSASTSGVLTTQGQTLELTVTFPAPATLSVQVLVGDTNEPAVDAIISGVSSSGLEFRTDANGRLLLPDLAPGQVQAFAYHCAPSWFHCVTQSVGSAVVDLISGETTPATIRVFPQ
jgi:hypothetical protein